MSSTDLDAPPLKLILAAIIIVVGLHVLTAVALVAIKTPEIKVEPEKDTPPIEIEMVTLPAETKEPEVAMDTAEPVKPIQPQPRSVTTTKPEIVKESQPLAKTKPAVKPVVTSEKPNLKPKTKAQPDTTKAVENEPFKHEVKRQESISTAQADALAADNNRKILAAQAKKAAQEAQQLADAKAAREAQAEVDAKKAAEAKAAAEAAARAKAQAAAAAASNTPVNFTATNANWASRPNFSFPTSAARRARSGDKLTVVLVLRVNKQGGIDNVRVAQSSGNRLLDQAAQKQADSGKFKPFTEAGVPVVGNVTLPIEYVVP
ncbi:TonB family protein [Psychrobacter sp. N25K4-3-2]|uniref:energy transducer TonB n=1 Tax=Psychrobacter sp. N25K4-3-2 TaxID=2785026 RepID=UPI00188C8A0C|nr:energy transducer TonB [Psychrobacter sp. N25K4-3-2]MBF4488978.1 TonB family protein [Psychrobacter sp. N25K4-3-2]